MKEAIVKLVLSPLIDDVFLGAASGGTIPMYYTLKYDHEIDHYKRGNYIFRRGFILFFHSTHIMYSLDRDMVIKLKGHGYKREYIIRHKWNFKPKNK